MNPHRSKRTGRAPALVGAMALVLVGACGDAPTALSSPGPVEGAPFVQGRVERRPVPTDDWGFLVLAPSRRGQDPVGAFFHLHEDTPILCEDGRAATRDEVRVGRRVSVWADPRHPVLLSMPPRISVSALVLHDCAPG